jgi:hypothetical protein
MLFDGKCESFNAEFVWDNNLFGLVSVWVQN